MLLLPLTQGATPMPSWHAYAAETELRAGLEIIFTGGTEVVRLMTGDQVVIEMSEASRISGVVVDRTGEQLALGFADGRMLRLHMVSDLGLADFKLSDGFSRQSWAVDG
jgi:hypothetical protein